MPTQHGPFGTMTDTSAATAMVTTVVTSIILTMMSAVRTIPGSPTLRATCGERDRVPTLPVCIILILRFLCFEVRIRQLMHQKIASSPKTSATNKGAIAGGVIGGVCGALIIAGIIWFFCRRHRPKTRKIEEAAPVASNSPSLQRDARLVEFPNELGDDDLEPSEIGGSRERKEMPSSMQPLGDIARTHPPSELP